jgi:hypothetical protein
MMSMGFQETSQTSSLTHPHLHLHLHHAHIVFLCLKPCTNILFPRVIAPSLLFHRLIIETLILRFVPIMVLGSLSIILMTEHKDAQVIQVTRCSMAKDLECQPQITETIGMAKVSQLAEELLEPLNNLTTTCNRTNAELNNSLQLGRDVSSVMVMAHDMC